MLSNCRGGASLVVVNMHLPNTGGDQDALDINEGARNKVFEATL